MALLFGYLLFNAELNFVLNFVQENESSEEDEKEFSTRFTRKTRNETKAKSYQEYSSDLSEEDGNFLRKVKLTFKQRTKIKSSSSEDLEDLDSDQLFEEGEDTLSRNRKRYHKEEGKKSKRIKIDYSLSESEHDHDCRICRDGGKLICCDTCPDVYHLDCLIPPLQQAPAGEWKCPRCNCDPLPGKVSKIITFRWKDHQEKTADSDCPKESQIVAQSKRRKNRKNDQREFFVKWKEASYWNCSWVQEIQLEVHWPIGYRFYMARNINEEPLECDDCQEATDIDPIIYDEFVKYGIRPGWLQPNRAINKRTIPDGTIQYLVKWQDLSYENCTWESKDKKIPGLAIAIQDYEDLRELRNQKKSNAKGLEMPTTNLNIKYKDNRMCEWLPEGLALHPYQLEGVSWARHSWGNKTNIILADEMGLGKTIQAITFLYSLFKEGHCKGPFLVTVPLSTLVNWEREFALWAPEFYVVSYTGYQEDRRVIREHELTFENKVRATKRVTRLDSNMIKFDVLLTSYENITSDAACLTSFNWEAVVVDEAHRLKNNKTLLFRDLSTYKVNYRMLLTGTPLQNNLQELFYLLNFLTPNKFKDLDEFEETFQDVGKEEQVRKLHELLSPHMLRRMKADVLKAIPPKLEMIVRTNLTALQRQVYKNILTRNFAALAAKSGGHVSLLNIMMELKKCTNHPFLLPGNPLLLKSIKF